MLFDSYIYQLVNTTRTSIEVMGGVVGNHEVAIQEILYSQVVTIPTVFDPTITKCSYINAWPHQPVLWQFNLVIIYM